MQIEDQHAAFTAMGRLARMPFTTGNSVALLPDGRATFSAIFEAIGRAKDYVLVQFYIIRADEVGLEMEKALLAARTRGVRVMVLYDEIGSYSLPSAYLDRLRAAGCECSGFRTKRRKQQPFRINFRNHRKIVVVDGRDAFVGGNNVGREYLGLDPKFGPWRDTHVVIHGPGVQCLQLAFLEDWYWANRRTPALCWTPEAVKDSQTRLLIVPSGPADMLETCELMYMLLANAAKKRLWLATPYFVPDEQIVSVLQLAALRGVDVRLIVAGKTDSIMAKYSMISYMQELLPVGIKVFRYEKGFMHQKVALCDDIAVVGTANLDNRSFRINFEVSAVVADPAFASDVAKMLEEDIANCTNMPKDAFTRLPWRIRILARICRLFAPIQ